MSFIKKLKSSLYFKLTLPIVAVSLLLLLSLTAMHAYQTDENIARHSSNLAKNVSDTLVVAVETDAEAPNLRRVVSALAARNNIQRIIIIEQASGTIAADNHHANIGLNIKSALNKPEYGIYSKLITNLNGASNQVNDRTFYHLKPIRLINPDINRIRQYQVFIIFTDTEAINTASTDLVNMTSLFVLGILLMSIAQYFTQRKVLLIPLTKITNTIQQQSDQTKTINMDHLAKDELGTLVESYNTLINTKAERDKELSETRHYIDGITHAVPVLLSYVDSDRKFRFVNKNYEEWFGIKTEEFIGATMADTLGEEAYAKAKKYIDSALEGNHITFELEIPYKTGLRYVQANYMPDIDDDYQVRGFFICVEDMSEAKKNETKLADYAQKLEFREMALEEEKQVAENALKIKSQFLASMSHEIRTPMNGVLGMLGLLINTDLNDDQMHKASLAKSSAESLLTLINDILDFSKIESGKMDLEVIDFDPSDMLGNLAETLGSQAQEKGVELILDTSDIDRSLVKGDPGRIRQVITNLVSNAIKFTQEGEVIIRAAVYEGFDDTLDFICEVKDSGIGIETSKLRSIFDSFTQVDASTTRKFGGTGLGLAIARNLCQLMGGDIHATSKEGKGSTFKCSIPLDASENSKPIHSLIDLTKTPVLIVDSNAANRLALNTQLHCWGAPVSEAANGAEAMSIVKVNADNDLLESIIILIDQTLPDLSAIALAEQIKQLDDKKKFKLILMAPLSVQENNDHFLSQGFCSRLFKPATVKTLHRCLAKAVQHQAGEDNLTKLDRNNTQLKTDNENNSDTAYSWPKNTRILLVEDVHINQLVIQGLLEIFDLSCDIAANGLEALDMISSANSTVPYNLIFMDCLMPELDGYQATKAIREGQAGEEAKPTPIVAMTANAMKGDEEACLAAGMDDYISKPVSGEKLEAMLIKWLIQKQS